MNEHTSYVVYGKAVCYSQTCSLYAEIIMRSLTMWETFTFKDVPPSNISYADDTVITSYDKEENQSMLISLEKESKKRMQTTQIIT